MLAEGQSVGNYRILSKIGTGGMGAVYLAEHPLIGKRVALKVIHRELSGNKEVVQRFFQEARAVNKIGHEHIIEIHDFGQSPEGDHFYIMEYLEGKTLASVIGREKVLEVTRALHIGAQIAGALAAAHAAGVIHRDLKPDNIMLVSRLGDRDFVKVLDFGLAKFLAGGGPGIKQLTAAGVVLGTPQYMSPEACESRRDVDHRTDIYAVGILLFQMMCGQLPFDGETMGEVLIKQVTQPPPAPRGCNAAIPPAVEQIILRCLAKQPDRRFPTMNALREALLNPDAYLSSSPPIMPARSVVPGTAPVDARTMMAHIDDKARGQTAIGSRMPLPPLEGPTLVGKMSAQRAAVGLAETAAGGMIAANPAAAQPTVAMTGVVPGMAPPVPAKNATMVIATPAGYSSRPPTTWWPIMLVAVLLGAIVASGIVIAIRRNDAGAGPAEGGGASGTAIGTGTGTAAATATNAGTATAAGTGTAAGTAAGTATATDAATAAASGTGSGSGSGPGSGTGSGSGSGSGSGTGTGTGTGTGSGKPTSPSKIRVSFETMPDGAEVRRNGVLLGKTPISVWVDRADKSGSFELRLRGYKPVTKKVDLADNISVLETLVRAPKPRTGGGKGSTGGGTGTGSGNGLLDPDDI